MQLTAAAGLCLYVPIHVTATMHEVEARARALRVPLFGKLIHISISKASSFLNSIKLQNKYVGHVIVAAVFWDLIN
jgi:hypothetical protein